MTDAQLQLQALTDATASVTSPTLDLSKGTGQFAPSGAGQPMTADVRVTFIDATHGTYAFKVQQSPDGTTWADASMAVAATAVGVVKIGVFVTASYVRLVMTAARRTSPTSRT